MSDAAQPASTGALRAAVILFDGGFRESFHTLDFLARQTLPPWHPQDESSDDLRRGRQHAVIGHVVTKRVRCAEPGYDVAAVG